MEKITIEHTETPEYAKLFQNFSFDLQNEFEVTNKIGNENNKLIIIGFPELIFFSNYNKNKLELLLNKSFNFIMQHIALHNNIADYNLYTGEGEGFLYFRAEKVDVLEAKKSFDAFIEIIVKEKNTSKK